MEENNKNENEVLIEEDLNSTIENVENKDEPKKKAYREIKSIR